MKNYLDSLLLPLLSLKGKHILPIFFIGLYCTPLIGQISPTYGVKAGPTLRTAFLGGTDKDPDTNAGIIIGFQVGGIIEIELNEDTRIQSGLSILSKGHRENDHFLDDFADYTAIYLEIPFNILFRASEFWIGGGPYFAFAMGAQRDYYGKDVLSVGNSRFDDWAPLDIGLGLRGYRAVGPVLVGAEIEVGLLNSYPHGQGVNYDYVINNFNINLVAAYMFE